jgi:hypothetical protein
MSKDVWRCASSDLESATNYETELFFTRALYSIEYHPRMMIVVG